MFPLPWLGMAVIGVNHHFNAGRNIAFLRAEDRACEGPFNTLFSFPPLVVLHTLWAILGHLLRWRAQGSPDLSLQQACVFAEFGKPPFFALDVC